MKRAIAVLAFAAVMLPGCASSKMTPAEQVNLINAFAGAGCKGDIHVSAGVGSGQLGGGGHAEVSLNGACDPATNPPAAHTVPASNPVT
jgi:hypothetical protein